MKFLVIGDPGVGKSTLISHISDGNSFSSLSQEKSIFLQESFCILILYLDFELKFWSCKAFNQKLGLFEVSTLEKPCTDCLAQYKDIDGILFLFSLDDINTFQNLSEWIESSSVTIPRFLIGNKKSPKENADFHHDHLQLPYFEVSAFEKIEVECLFSTLIQKIKKFKAQNFAFRHEISSTLFIYGINLKK